MKKIQVQFILEILGRPPEHVTEALNLMIEKISKEEGIVIISKAVHEPIPVKEAKELYTNFAEITAELDTLAHYFRIIFSYFPSNIEVIYPEELVLSNNYLNEVGHALTQRLHDYDAIAKKTIAENEILTNKLKEVAPHLFPPESRPRAQQQKIQQVQKKTSKESSVKKAKKSSQKINKGKKDNLRFHK
jgi:hypothetical protein